MDSQRIIEQLPIYIDWHFTKKQPASVNWRDHILRSRYEEYQSISFEELKRTPSKGLIQVLSGLGHSQIDMDKLNTSIYINDISNKKTKNNGYQVRSGRTGEWRQYFTAESAHCFQKNAGDELIMLGYEADSSWVGKF
jgi:hypothetical protein